MGKQSGAFHCGRSKDRAVNQRISDVGGFGKSIRLSYITQSTDGVSVERSRAAPGFLHPALQHRHHGMGHIASGPDGMLYLSSGSRTDSGEAGNDPRISNEGETPLTSCLWKLDPKAENPRIEVVARGLRNAYGFAWDDVGRLFTVSNGPDSDAPEEMNLIKPGNHYGFPYQYSDWSVARRLYAHTPAAPAGMEFTMPLANLALMAAARLAGRWPPSIRIRHPRA